MAPPFSLKGVCSKSSLPSIRKDTHVIPCNYCKLLVEIYMFVQLQPGNLIFREITCGFNKSLCKI